MYLPAHGPPNELTTVIRETVACLEFPPGERSLEITHSQGSHGWHPKAAGGKLVVKSGSQKRERSWSW